MSKQKVVYLSGAFAGAMVIATASVLLLRRVGRDGVKRTIFNDRSVPQSEPADRRQQKRVLISLRVFEDRLKSDPALYQKVEVLTQRIYHQIGTGSAHGCVQSLNDLFALLTPGTEFPGQWYSNQLKFRTDIKEVVKSLFTQPLLAQATLKKWRNWWVGGENFLPPYCMWQALTMVEVGLTYFENQNPRKVHLFNQPEGWLVQNLLGVGIQLMGNGNPEELLENLTALSEYLIDNGYQAA